MADIRKPANDLGRVGPRGPRGHRGDTGPRGPTGPTGPTPTGDPNTQAYFGPDGKLTDDLNATMSLTDWQIKTVPGAANVAHLRRDIGSAAFGNNSTATAANAFAAGNSAAATGLASHAEGNATSAVGVASHAEGSVTVAFVDQAHAEGDNTLAAGISSHAEGSNSSANGAFSHAQGLFSDALRVGQHAHSSGPGRLNAPHNPGDTQYGLVTMAGQTPGAAPGEVADVLLGETPGSPFVLAIDKAYTFVITVVMEGTIAGAANMQSFRRMFAVRPQAGVPTLVASGAAEQIGDAGAATWTITVAVLAGVFLSIRFSTGATTAAAQVTATVEFTEIRAT